MQGLKTNSRKRRQGMTEYVILVGLVGILLIGGVNMFSFRLDEAIQGSVRAMITHLNPPDSYGVSDGAVAGADVFEAFSEDDSGNKHTIHLKNVGGEWVPWVDDTNSEYDRTSHGAITSRAGH